MSTSDDLPVEWSVIEAEGLVRVFPMDSFREGLQLTMLTAQAAEAVGYAPEISWSKEKVIITIPLDSDGLSYQLAHTIESMLHDASR